MSDMTEFEAKCLDAMADYGLTPDTLLLDGKYHRFPGAEKGRRDKAAWYIGSEGTTPSGYGYMCVSYGDYRQGIQDCYKSWRENGLSQLDANELEELRRVQAEQAAEAERQVQEQHRKAAKTATEQWESYSPAPSQHPYLERKHIEPHGARLDEYGNLVIPAMDLEGNIHCLQRIAPTGKKLFTKGGSKKSHFYVIGRLDDATDILLCEGFSTGAALHQCTGFPVVVTFDSGNLVRVAAVLADSQHLAEFLVCADDDWKTKRNPGRTKGVIAAQVLQAKLALPLFDQDRPPRATDFNDLASLEGEKAVQHSLGQAKPIRDLGDRLIVNKEGQPKACMHNCAVILRTEPEWQGVLRYNEFNMRVEKGKPPPYEHGVEGEWTDYDTLATTSWISRCHDMTPSSAVMQESVLLAAHANPYHPVIEYLDELDWDGEERIDHWLQDIAGAEHNDYVRAVGRRFLIAAVARIKNPGVKFDNVLMLEGKQGLLKSTLFQVLAGAEWFLDEPLSFNDKDALMLLQGAWIVEMAELESMRKAEAEQAKAFLSKTRDVFRPPYGRALVTRDRQCVFVGTTNPTEYLKDQTGNRRFWPIRASDIRLDLLRQNRNQLWAEAVAAYEAGERWWLCASEDAEIIDYADQEAEMRVHQDPWEEKIQQWLAAPNQQTRRSISGGEILDDVLKVETPRQNRSDQTRIGLIMQRLGWTKVRRRSSSGRREYSYERSE